MEIRHDIEGGRKEIRKSLFINRKHTLTEVYRIKALFRETEEVVAKIENLLRNQKGSRGECYPKHRIREESEHLLIIYESLNGMLRDDSSIQERFIFDIAKAKGQIGDTLDKALSFCNLVWI